MLGVPAAYDWIAHHAGRRPATLAIHDLQTARKFTYAELDARTDRLAAPPGYPAASAATG